MAKWTFEEIERLKAEYPVMLSTDIDGMARYYNHSWTAITKKANLLGLRRQYLDFSGRPFDDETGNIYGALTVLRRVTDKKRKSKGVVWECKCECGSIVTREGGQLRRSRKLGQNPNCGCQQRLPRGESAFNAVFLEYKRSAERRNHEWYLTEDEVQQLIRQSCFYCGREPSDLKYKRLQGGITMNGIDRIDNNVGYRIDNCCACCSICNKAKGVLNRDEFLSMARRIYLYQGP